MDLGTADTPAFVPSQDGVLNRPSVAGVDAFGRAAAIGLEAGQFIGTTPHGLDAIRPLRDHRRCRRGAGHARRLPEKNRQRDATALRGAGLTPDAPDCYGDRLIAC